VTGNFNNIGDTVDESIVYGDATCAVTSYSLIWDVDPNFTHSSCLGVTVFVL
jgi:hypothetical protein